MQNKKMKRYLITGFSGFVARHFMCFLENETTDTEILGIDLNEPDYSFNKNKISCTFKKVNLLDFDSLTRLLQDYKPQYILHLASYSSVALSWKNPIITFQNNTGIFLNLIEAVRKTNSNPRIISVGSSEEYGNVNEQDLPLREDCNLNPLSPYAVARVSQEMFSKIYMSGYKLDIILTRSFNHIGPYQKDFFVVSSFVKKILECQKKKEDIVIETGDLSIIRDFVDVRDAVRAYYLLFQYGETGEIYNICSGVGYSLKDIIDMISKRLNINVITVVNQSLIRPDDNKKIIGSNEKIKKQTGWKPLIPIEKSIDDIINYWKSNESII